MVNGVLITVFYLPTRLRKLPGAWVIVTQDVRKEDGSELATRIPLFGFSTRKEDDLLISGDGEILISVDPWKIKTWSVSTGERRRTIPHTWFEEQQPFSTTLDDSVIWIRYSESLQVRGWSVRSLTPCQSDPPGTLGRPLGLVQADGTEGDNVRLAWIENTVSKAEIFQLPTRFAERGEVQWDGQVLVAADERGDLLILDFLHLSLQ